MTAILWTSHDGVYLSQWIVQQGSESLRYELQILKSRQKSAVTLGHGYIHNTVQDPTRPHQLASFPGPLFVGGSGLRMRLLIRVNGGPNKTHLNTQTAMYTQMCNITQIPYFFNQTPQLLFFRCSFLCGYYSRAAFISLESLKTPTMAG